jgi:hypothetical protein
VPSINRFLERENFVPSHAPWYQHRNTNSGKFLGV